MLCSEMERQRKCLNINRHGVVCPRDGNITLFQLNPDSKVHGANMGPTWVLSAPDGPHVRPMNLVIREVSLICIFDEYKYRQQSNVGYNISTHMIATNYEISSMSIYIEVIKWKHLCPFVRGIPTGHRWIPLTKDSDTELGCFVWSAPGQMVEQKVGKLERHRAHYDVTAMDQEIILKKSRLHDYQWIFHISHIVNSHT